MTAMQQLTIFDVEVQTCARCRVDLPLDAYHPGKRGKRGTYCRSCCTEYTRERYVRKPSPRRRCQHASCDSPPASRWARYCIEHHPRRTRTRGYAAQHLYVATVRGRAAEQLCAHCTRPADHWAYDHADPDPLTEHRDGHSVSYSADPAHYIALCRSCHTRFDRRDRGNTNTGQVLRWISEHGPVRVGDIRRRFPRMYVSTIISRAVGTGDLIRVDRGVYRVADSSRFSRAHPALSLIHI